MKSQTFTVMDNKEWNHLVRDFWHVPEYSVTDWEECCDDYLECFTGSELSEYDYQVLETFDKDHAYNMRHIFATALAENGIIPKGQNVLIYFW